MAEYCEEECLYPALVPTYPIISCDGVTVFSWNTEVASSDNKPASTEYQRKQYYIMCKYKQYFIWGGEDAFIPSPLNFTTLLHMQHVLQEEFAHLHP